MNPKPQEQQTSPLIGIVRGIIDELKKRAEAAEKRAADAERRYAELVEMTGTRISQDAHLERDDRA